jgi:aspartate/glutamate racemase
MVPESSPGEATDGPMKTICVLGGMSGVASAEYYPRINEGINAHRGGHAAAELVLYSVDFAVIEGLSAQSSGMRPRSTSPNGRSSLSAPARSS